MFFWRKKKKSIEEQQIETSIKDLQLYLENNYKDLAISSRKEAVELVERYYSAGKLSKAAYLQYKKTLAFYIEEMKNYNHQEFYHS
ncbi:MAG: hypothetical protein J6F30_02710 [Cellulosilyticum sp.]|nr:hypothetical protein [Cellulosilyticum sp.]